MNLFELAMVKRNLSWNDLADKPFSTEYNTEIIVPRVIRINNEPSFDLGYLFNEERLEFHRFSTDIDWYTDENLRNNKWLVFPKFPRCNTKLEDISDSFDYDGVSVYEVVQWNTVETEYGTEDSRLLHFIIVRVAVPDYGLPIGLYIACLWFPNPFDQHENLQYNPNYNGGSDILVGGHLDDDFVVFGTEIVTLIDEKYLPKSVDGITLRSSTEGSAKKFKLTVDDSGTISATEI